MKSVAAVIVCVAALVTAVVLATAGANAPQGPTQQYREVHAFDDLAPMVAVSDAVVQGTITESSPGRTVGGDADIGGLQFIEVTLQVETVLYGDLPKGSVTLEIDGSMVPRQDRWDVPGKSVLLFLHEKSDRRGYYRPTNSQGVFVVEGDRIAAGVVEDAFTDGLARLDRDKLVEEIKIAADAVRDGFVTPPPPALGTSG
jgi:hypothetical protein